jgi:aspartate oxidase
MCLINAKSLLKLANIPIVYEKETACSYTCSTEYAQHGIAMCVSFSKSHDHGMDTFDEIYTKF